MVRNPNPNTDQVSRSILQKAIRRGDNDLTQKVVSYLIQHDDFDWVRKRLAVITFEECWTYGLDISYEANEAVICNHYLNLASTIKNKNAAGLGSLAYELSKGDSSVLQKNTSDRSIKIIEQAIHRPDDFWKWVHKEVSNNKQRVLVSNAHRGFNRAGWIWDKTFTQAAAYLAISEEIPNTVFLAQNSDPNFPLWIGIDKHTPEGKIAIRNAAKKNSIDEEKALWLSFYFESAVCNYIENSIWWEREVSWRMSKLGLNVEKGMEIWQKIRPIIKDGLEKKTEEFKDKFNAIQLILTKDKSTQIKMF